MIILRRWDLVTLGPSALLVMELDSGVTANHGIAAAPTAPSRTMIDVRFYNSKTPTR